MYQMTVGRMYMELSREFMEAHQTTRPVHGSAWNCRYTSWMCIKLPPCTWKRTKVRGIAKNHIQQLVPAFTVESYLLCPHVQPSNNKNNIRIASNKGYSIQKKAEQADIRCHSSPLLTTPYSSGGKKRHWLCLLQEMCG